MTILWLVLMIVFGAVEVATVGLTSLWFAVGSLAAMISAICGAPQWLQFVWFLVISLAMLIMTRPLVKKFHNTIRKPTNADRVLTMTGVVTQDVSNDLSVGAVRVDGKEWSARSDSGEDIPAGTLVRPVAIEGVKLFVRPVAREKCSAPETAMEE